MFHAHSRIREEVADGDFASASIGDLMSALLFAFMLMTLVYQLVLQEREQKVQDTIGIDEKVMSDLERALNLRNVAAEIAEGSFEIVLKEDLLFDRGEAALQPEGVALLDGVFQAIEETILANAEYRGAVSQILVIGYTSADGDSAYNMRLGAERSLAVFAQADQFAGRMDESEGGSAFSKLFIYSSRGELDASPQVAEVDRKVVLKVQFSSAERAVEYIKGGALQKSTKAAR